MADMLVKLYPLPTAPGLEARLRVDDAPDAGLVRRREERHCRKERRQRHRGPACGGMQDGGVT